jgi:hypothetical protein
VENIKIRRLEWAGHIMRMEEERITKKFLNGNFHTTRAVGRPRTRWADVVQRNALRLLPIRGWRRKCANRDEWRRLVREAEPRKGHMKVLRLSALCTCHLYTQETFLVLISVTG